MPIFYSQLYKRRSISQQQISLLGDVMFGWYELVMDNKLLKLQEMEDEFAGDDLGAHTSDDYVMNSLNQTGIGLELSTSEEFGSSDVTTQLIRASLSLSNMDLEDFRFDVNLTPMSEKSVLRQDRLFYSCGNETKAVYVQLCQTILHQFEDEECLEEIGRIDFRSITTVCYIDEDTFELNTAIHDKVHVFAFYDTNCHNSEEWITDIVTKCGISRIALESEYSTSYYITTKSSIDEILLPPVVIEPEVHSWYHTLYWLCCIEKLFYPRAVAFR